MISDLEKELEKAFISLLRKKGLVLTFNYHPDDKEQNIKTPDSRYNSEGNFYDIEHTQLIEQKDKQRTEAFFKSLTNLDIRELIPPGGYEIGFITNNNVIEILKKLNREKIKNLFKKAYKQKLFGTVSDELVYIRKVSIDENVKYYAGFNYSSVPAQTLSKESLNAILEEANKKFLWKTKSNGILLLYANNANKGPILIKQIFETVNFTKYAKVKYVSIVVNYPYTDQPLTEGEKSGDFIFFNIFNKLHL